METPPPYQITLGCDPSFPPIPSIYQQQINQQQQLKQQQINQQQQLKQQLNQQQQLKQQLNQQQQLQDPHGSSCFTEDSTQLYARVRPRESTQDQFPRLENQQDHHNNHHHHQLHHNHHRRHHQQKQQLNTDKSHKPCKPHSTLENSVRTPPRLTGSSPLMYTASIVPLIDQSPSGSSSGSNRSSTLSSNSSGYSGSCGQLPPPHVKQHHRLSGQSIESGISTLSSQYVSTTPVTSSQTSLEKDEAGSNLSANAPLQRNSDPYQQGLKEAEALYSWLQDINQVDCYQLFLQSGYDKPTISRMTPEDLTAIGITVPSIRKKLTFEINKLHIPEGIPNYWPSSLKEWLNLLHLQKYFENLMKEGYHSLEDVLQITWEDLEDIGITKLGHQKKITLAIEKLKKIHAAKNLPQSTTDIFDFSSSSSSSKSRKRSPVPCHKLIVDQITAKNKSKEILTKKSPEIIHLNPAEVPAPEIVAIKVNRSWSACQQEHERPLKYESFHGNPSRDFKSLLKETSPNREIFQSQQSPPIRFYEPPPSPAPDSSLSSPVKMRSPPQVAPKPCTRNRRASGGATIGISFEAEMLNSSVLKRQNSCQGSILAQFSPICDSYRPADIFHHPSMYHEDDVRHVTSDKWKKSTPPAPPKRTNSIKCELNTISNSDNYQKFSGNISREMDNMADLNAKLPPLARGFSRNWSVQNKITPSNQAAVSIKSVSNEKISADCNTLPFANENVGTIKPKSSQWTHSDPSKRPPVKPKPKATPGSMNSSPIKQNSENDSEVNCDSVFDDIDSMFQGLTKELDEMLIG